MKRITINAAICHGKPVISRTRVLVSNILADLADGRSYEEIIHSYPGITSEDIQEALMFGSELSRFETVSVITDQ